MLVNCALLAMMALCVGSILAHFHIPIPFLLGGMLTAIFCKSCIRKRDFSWPREWREYALMVAGYGIGANFSQEAWQNIMAQTLGVFEATGSILLASLLCSYLTAKVTHEDHKSCLMGMMPGGLTVMMVLSEEDKEVNPNIVAVMQVLRMLMVVVCVPFLTVYLLNAQVMGNALSAPNHGGVHWAIFIPLAILGSFLAKKVHLPTPTMLGPIIATAVFAMHVGTVQPVPAWIMCPAQISIGLYMGMQMNVERILRTKKMVPFIIFTGAAMIAMSVAMANVLSSRYGFSLTTAFLAMAPGGIAEMSLAGLSMGEDVSIILTYQLVRVLFINIMIPPCLKYFFKRQPNKEAIS